MMMRTFLPVALGAIACLAIAGVAAQATGPALIADLNARTAAALAATGVNGVNARFVTSGGWLTRHPVLTAEEGVDPASRKRAAAAVAAVAGIGGVQWRAFSPPPRRGQIKRSCQQDVEAILRTRTIRFAEASAAIDPVSAALLDEVAQALRPCAGSLIAISGHTDTQGEQARNVELSLERARAVREALVVRGIERSGLRARGYGALRPVEGLDPADPANRRIEFAVITLAAPLPTVVDTPGAGAGE